MVALLGLFLKPCYHFNMAAHRLDRYPAGRANSGIEHRKRCAGAQHCDGGELEAISKIQRYWIEALGAIFTFTHEEVIGPS
jgi:hypothetical protein